MKIIILIGSILFIFLLFKILSERNKINLMMEYLQPILGFFALLLLGAVFSENIKAIKIKYLVSAVVIQVVLAYMLINLPIISSFFEYLSYGVMTLKDANDYGTAFVFGYLADGAPNAPFEISNEANTFIFAFGLSFQLPVILSLLARVGIVDSQFLKDRRKYVVVIIFAAAALLTPPDPITQIGLAIPLLILYELSIFSVKFIENKNLKKTDA